MNAHRFRVAACGVGCLIALVLGTSPLSAYAAMDMPLQAQRRDVCSDPPGDPAAAPPPLNLSPGPEYGEVLKRVLHAKLNGQVNTREEQLELAGKLLIMLRGKQGLPREVLQGRT